MKNNEKALLFRGALFFLPEIASIYNLLKNWRFVNNLFMEIDTKCVIMSTTNKENHKEWYRKELKKMLVTGYFEKMNEQHEVKRFKNIRFESTGIKNECGKVIWRKLNKDGTPSNIFAEQFVPDMPWVVGKWFAKVNSATVLRKHPQLKVETERSKTMSDAEYLEFLDSTYFG